jgi:hypothetical protein
MLRTQWKVVTSEETSGSLVLSISWGKIYLVNENDKDDTLTIKYRCISAGESKGPPVGANWSSTSDPSGGVGNVSDFALPLAQKKKMPRRGRLPCGARILAGVLERRFPETHLVEPSINASHVGEDVVSRLAQFLRATSGSMNRRLMRWIACG